MLNARSKETATEREVLLMDRLTGRNEFGEVTSYNPVTEHVAGDKEIRDRLAEYEDIGLTPEEIKLFLHDRGIGLAIRSREAREESARLRSRLRQAERALELACEEVVEVDEGNCPGCVKDNKLMHPGGCPVPKERYKNCWRDYFLAQVEDVDV